MDEMRLVGIRVMGKHGVLAFEKEWGQPFEVDVALMLDLTQAGLTDDLSATVNYALVYDLVAFEVGQTCYDLIEKLCYRILCRVLVLDDRIVSCEVTIRKPNAPIYGQFDHASVKMKRDRHACDLSEFRQ